MAISSLGLRFARVGGRLYCSVALPSLSIRVPAHSLEDARSEKLATWRVAPRLAPPQALLRTHDTCPGPDFAVLSLSLSLLLLLVVLLWVWHFPFRSLINIAQKTR